MVAAVGFANRLVLGLQGLAGLALQRAGLPLLSRLAARSPADAWHATQRWALGGAAAGAAMGLAVAVMADPLVGLLYEHGRFSAQDREQVATLLRYGMLQMPAFLAGTVLVTALAASRGGALLALAAGTGLVAKLALSAALVAWQGIAGLLLATARMYTLSTVMVWAALKRRLRAELL
jgi:peptidoglycan biosynthesis protein MviN/MurJ (putative lipid II flippase)